MIFENVKSDGMLKEYKVVLGAAEIEDEIDRAVNERRKTFKVAGFRTGHVPYQVVRNSVEDSVTKDILDSLISKACDKVIKDSKVQDLVSSPTYRLENAYEKGKDVEVFLMLEPAPSFELKPIDLEIERIIPKVSDEEVDEERERLMKVVLVHEKAKKEHQIQPKDEVSYKAICYNNGIESKKKSFENKIVIPEEIPEGSEFFQGFIGKKEGEEFEFTPATDKNLKYRFVVK
jgi:trigger factor